MFDPIFKRKEHGRTGKTPWGDDFDVGLEAIEGELETDLIVTLTGATVRDKARRMMNMGQFLCAENWFEKSGP